MSESAMRTKTVKVLRPLGAFAVENPALPGTPDVCYRDGWMELKWSRSWPFRPDSPVPCEHYSPQPRIFHRTFWNYGGIVHLLAVEFR